MLLSLIISFFSFNKGKQNGDYTLVVSVMLVKVFASRWRELNAMVADFVYIGDHLFSCGARYSDESAEFTSLFFYE